MKKIKKIIEKLAKANEKAFKGRRLDYSYMKTA